MQEMDWKRTLSIIRGEDSPLARKIEEVALSAAGTWLAKGASTGAMPVFRHPLSSAEQKKYVSTKSCDAVVAELCAKLPKEVDAKKLCHLIWRFGAELLPEEAFTPACQCLPDFTVWNHLAAKAALANCFLEDKLRPAFLLFQIGPVQEFIAQARSTRDLWSGSYLLSWLVAHALKAITDRLGPAAVIFPNLRGNGIFDALHRDLYQETGMWLQITQPHNENDDFSVRALTPTLPNRFLALVPASDAEALAKKAEEALLDELNSLCRPVWKWIAVQAMAVGVSPGELAQWKQRWEAQIADFPKITWAVQPWEGLDPNTLEPFRSLPINDCKQTKEGGRLLPVDNLKRLLEKAEDPAKPGVLWSAYYAMADAKLAARRNTRDFYAWRTGNADNAVKDSLSGKEEIIGNEDFWKSLAEQPLFSKARGHRYGAMNLVKRLWCRPERDALGGFPDTLWHKLGLKEEVFSAALHFDSAEDIIGRNKGKGDEEGKGKYVAVLAMDGDEMGKWISGEKTPLLPKQLGEVKDANGLDGLHRVLTPGYHLQFSEALSNFSNWEAASIVEGCDGQLIYAGGDDVLAMLPATRALECAQRLQKMFRQDFAGNLLMPGTASNVSVGIAFGHHKAPLQMLVKEAQAAEHRAKHEYGRGAVAISLYKRSGEIIQWGCKWGSPALPLMEFLAVETRENGISERFPYALARVLGQYGLASESKRLEQIPPEDLKEIIRKELDVVIRQQASALEKEKADELKKLCREWCETCDKLEDFIQPFLSEAFINRNIGEE